MSLRLNTIRPEEGTVHKKKRVGRGPGSGKGKTSARGEKGQKSRSGYSAKIGFEGGQMPLHRRLPKRGFTPPFREEPQVVALEDLTKIPNGTEVTRESLVAAGLIEANKGPAKLLANGELSQAVTVRGLKVSAGAKAKIEKAGGKVE